jgi:hypothetical protein
MTNKNIRFNPSVKEQIKYIENEINDIENIVGSSNEILEFKLDCSECNHMEYWTIEEFKWCGDYPYECDKCRHDELNITLINK